MKEIRTALDPVSGESVEIRNDLVNRLRGRYAVGPTLPNGEPEFGWREFGEPTKIDLEAANELERLRQLEGDVYDFIYGPPGPHVSENEAVAWRDLMYEKLMQAARVFQTSKTGQTFEKGNKA